MADGVRPARCRRQYDPDRDRALGDARKERHLRAGSDLARGSENGRHHRQVRLWRVIPAHALAGRDRGRGRQRRAAAQRARRRAARHVDRRRDESRGTRRPGPHRDLRSSRQLRASPGLARGCGVGRRVGEVAGRGLDDRQRTNGGHPPPAGDLHRHAQRRRDDKRLGGVQRQPVNVRVVDDRAAGGAGRKVSDARAGGRRDDDGGWLPSQCLGGRADGRPAHGLLLGRSRPALGRGKPGLRVTRGRLFERRDQPHPDPGRYRPRRRGRQPQGLHGGHRLSLRDRGRLRRRVHRRSPQPAVRSGSERRRQSGHGGYRSPPDRMGHQGPT